MLGIIFITVAIAAMLVYITTTTCRFIAEIKFRDK